MTEPTSRRARRAATASHAVAPEAPAPVLTPAFTETGSFALAEPTVRDEAAIDAEPTVRDEAAIDAEPVELAADAHESNDDAFAASARLFSFTGELPVREEAVQFDDAETVIVHPTTRATAAARRRVSRRAALKRATALSFSVGVMGAVGLLTVGMTTPAEAMAAMTAGSQGARIAAGDVGPADDDDEIQAYVAPSTIENATLDREGGYDTVTVAEVASDSGISNVSDLFVNDPNADIQWPFAVGVPMSYGFGMRSGTMHEGVDFTPGEGAPVQAIADGVVRVATEAGGAYGVHVIIDHEVDGVLVSSHYAHMLYGSLQVTAGQQVTVGTVIGNTGDTGYSFGAHTHFEILLNGTTAIDPLVWLQENAG
ncbi:M23 family metallopeptidase [Microbacterium marmarense]|uniref:Peptidoglycan DD-metalloendopeptidase family protein n=1 Tax=Microbacterium marmarense TaxID=3122051 RepID=A0ABU8LTH3_9MICO